MGPKEDKEDQPRPGMGLKAASVRVRAGEALCRGCACHWGLSMEAGVATYKSCKESKDGSFITGCRPLSSPSALSRVSIATTHRGVLAPRPGSEHLWQS